MLSLRWKYTCDICGTERATRDYEVAINCYIGIKDFVTLPEIAHGWQIVRDTVVCDKHEIKIENKE